MNLTIRLISAVEERCFLPKHIFWSVEIICFNSIVNKLNSARPNILMVLCGVFFPVNRFETTRPYESIPCIPWSTGDRFKQPSSSYTGRQHLWWPWEVQTYLQSISCIYPQSYRLLPDIELVPLCSLDCFVWFLTAVTRLNCCLRVHSPHQRLLETAYPQSYRRKKITKRLLGLGFGIQVPF